MDPTLNYQFWRVVVRSLAQVAWDLKIFNVERVPATGPVILACNHVSFADPPLVGVGIPRPTHFLARDTLFRNPLFGAWLRSLNSIPVDRDGGGAAGLRSVLSLLDRQEMVVLFPEGTRSADGRPQPARPGVGLIALKSGAPVVPVRMFGLFEAWGRHRKLPGLGKVIVKYGHPLRFGSGEGPTGGLGTTSPKVRNQWVADQIMSAIRGLEPMEEIDRFPSIE
jgi:1-acyl-sn-glycerol-3-phosphate acyltransferase